VFRKLILIIFCGIYATVAYAQEEEEDLDQPRIGSSILDDTTKVIYGPTTTEYFFYNDVVVGDTGVTYTIDTAVYDLHRFSFVDIHDRKYQDLGNMGTATRPIYYEFPETIGLTTGFNVYDVYARDASDIKFYNTRSPYSKIGVILGGAGRSVTDVSYSRNIDFRSNIGFDYHGIFVDKQIERARRGDRNAENVSYNLHGNYHTINGKYGAMGAFIRSNHEVDEYGGVKDTNPETPLHLFFEDTVKVSLGNTKVTDLRREYFFFHKYQLTPIIEIFHELRHYDQLIRLTSNINASPDAAFFPDRLLTDREVELYGGKDGTAIIDRNKFDEWSNRIGLSGNVGAGYYRVYYQHRDMNFDYRFLNSIVIDTMNLIPAVQRENLAGAMVRIGTEEDMQLMGQVDYTEGGFYNIFGRIALRPFYGSVRQVKRRPSYIETAYRSNLNEWYLNPDGPVTSELDAGLLFQGSDFEINAGAKFQRLTNYIYFINEGNEGSRPLQNDGTVTALMPHLNFTKWWGDHWLTKGEAIYSMVQGENPGIYPLPELFTNLQLSYNRISFDGNLQWQLGFDFHWRSPYFAPGYDPLVQQFYIQDDFITPGIPIIDVFLNAKINRARIFVKYTNLVQFVEGYGYMPTPYYPGQVSTFDFGFNWSFYD
jgi:hypothetical protein